VKARALLQNCSEIPRRKVPRSVARTRRGLETAIGQGADPKGLPDSFLLSHRREGEKCPRGNGEIRKIKAAERIAYYSRLLTER
jgi:formamidopyrimidine-DNA glycosylase